MKAILHIGTEKTGTTSLQAALAESRPMLEEAGFCYSRAAGERAHFALPLFAGRAAGLVDLMAMEGIKDIEALERYRLDFRARLTAEVTALPDACFIFSSEHCHSRLVDETCVAGLHRLLAPLFDDIEIVVYLRRQDRLATSYYSTYLRGGGTSNEIIPPPIAIDYFDYGAMLDRWAAVFGDQVTVASYDALEEDIARDFARRMRLPALSVDFSGNRALNPAISATVQEAIRQLSIAMPEFAGPAVTRLQAALIEADRGTPAKRLGARPARNRARAFVDRFGASNAYVAARYYGGRPLFDDCFDEYPEEDQPVAAERLLPLFGRALFKAERLRTDLAVENAALHEAVEIAARGNEQMRAALDAAELRNRDLAEENRNLHQSVIIAAQGNEQLRDALDRSVAANVAQDAQQKQVEAELGYYAGLVHFDAGKLDVAREIVSKALNRAPHHAALWHVLARTEHALGRHDSALAAIDRAIAIEPAVAAHRDIRAKFLGTGKAAESQMRARWFWQRSSNVLLLGVTLACL